MKTENITTLIRLGFEPARYFKRSAWVKVERVMEFLANKGEVLKLNGEVKYGTRNGGYNEEDLKRWSDMYLHSPLSEHMEEMKALSREMNLPLNSRELLSAFVNLNTK